MISSVTELTFVTWLNKILVCEITQFRNIIIGVTTLHLAWRAYIIYRVILPRLLSISVTPEKGPILISWIIPSLSIKKVVGIARA